MSSKAICIILLAFFVLLYGLFADDTDIPVVDKSRIKKFKEDLQKIIEDIRWAIGIYQDVKGSYQRLDKLLGDVYRDINSLIEGEALEILTDALTGDFKEILLSGEYFKGYITGRFEQLLKKAVSIEDYFGYSDKEVEVNGEIVYLGNPRLKKQYDHIREIRSELMATTEEALQILEQIQGINELIEKDSEMKIIEQIVNRHGELEKTSGKMVNTDSFWAVYAISEFKRMIKLFGTYAILEQKRKESLHRELLNARGYALQLSGVEYEPKGQEEEK